MENQRHFLTIGLIVISAILYFKWIEFSAEKAQPAATQVVTDTSLPAVPTVVPTAQDDPGAVPSVSEGDVAPAIPELKNAVDTASLIKVETDMVVAYINPLGGVIERLELREEPVALDKPEEGYPLLKKSAAEVFVTQDGLISNQGAPSHQTQYQTYQTEYSLGEQDEVRVPLSYVDDSGVEFVKTFRFKRDSYVVDINYDVQNKSATEWQGYQYAQFLSLIHI